MLLEIYILLGVGLHQIFASGTCPPKKLVPIKNGVNSVTLGIGYCEPSAFDKNSDGDFELSHPGAAHRYVLADLRSTLGYTFQKIMIIGGGDKAKDSFKFLSHITKPVILIVSREAFPGRSAPQSFIIGIQVEEGGKDNAEIRHLFGTKAADKVTLAALIPHHNMTRRDSACNVFILLKSTLVVSKAQMSTLKSMAWTGKIEDTDKYTDDTAGQNGTIHFDCQRRRNPNAKYYGDTSVT